MKSFKKLLLVLIPVLLAFGCSSTVMTGSWRNPDFKGQVKKVYIIGIAKQETTRRIFEDTFSAQLAKYGVTGMSSYQDLPISEKITQDEIADKASKNGVDSIILTRTVGKRTEEVVTPGQVTSYPTPVPRYGPRYGYYPDPYYRNYGSYYARSWDAVYQPPTVSQYEVVTIEANLYEYTTGDLIWSAQLETVVEGNLQNLIAGFIETVTKDLKEKGLI
jgi:hypothetical protein